MRNINVQIWSIVCTVSSRCQILDEIIREMSPTNWILIVYNYQDAINPLLVILAYWLKPSRYNFKDSVHIPCANRLLYLVLYTITYMGALEFLPLTDAMGLPSYILHSIDCEDSQVKVTSCQLSDIDMLKLAVK